MNEQQLNDWRARYLERNQPYFKRLIEELAEFMYRNDEKTTKLTFNLSAGGVAYNATFEMVRDENKLVLP